MSGDQLDLDAPGLAAWIEGHANDDDGVVMKALFAEAQRLRALPDMTLGWDSTKGVMVFTDVDTAQRVTLREWVDRP